MNSRKKSLMHELKWTVIALGTTMIAMWFLFYIYLNSLLNEYVIRSMEQASSQIISELNQSFLQLEEVSFFLSEDDAVYQLLNSSDGREFHARAAIVVDQMEQISIKSGFISNIVIYENSGRFYRFNGTISNTAAKRLISLIQKDSLQRHIQVQLDDINYVGYVTDVTENTSSLGKIVMLMDEIDIYHMFQEIEENNSMRIALAADEKVIVANDAAMLDKSLDELKELDDYIIQKQVGFTPFELVISYKSAGDKISILFLAVMVLMAFLLLMILERFLTFWRKKFFVPIQSVIVNVEAMEGRTGAFLMPTGLEHFDGLVHGINELIARIEQSDRQIYEAELFLQEAEIKKQKAYIVSLKKQINAHFTVNVLTVIKALTQAQESDKAGLLCDGLSFLLRYANAGDSFISGMEEFFVLEKYVSIMEIRYPNRFEVEIDMEDFLEEIELPRMLLQPIVENSILYGFVKSDLEHKGLIHVYPRLESETIKIIIEDSGVGMEMGHLKNLRDEINLAEDEDIPIEGLSHVALLNIQRRIRTYFGKEYGIIIDSEKGKGTRVTVLLPLVRKK